MKWHNFDRAFGSSQILPLERKKVLVQLPRITESSPPVVAVGYLRFAAGDGECPYFVTPGVGGDPIAWCDCLPDDFTAPLWNLPRVLDELSAAMARAAPYMGDPCEHGSTTNVCRRCACEAEIARLSSVVRDREAEILRIQTHETSAAHALDSQLSPEERAQFKALADENAGLRAANARLRACCQAWEAWDKASYRYHDPDNFEDNLYADLRRTHDARDAARHAVDEAGDLRT